MGVFLWVRYTSTVDPCVGVMIQIEGFVFLCSRRIAYLSVEDKVRG